MNRPVPGMQPGVRPSGAPRPPTPGAAPAARPLPSGHEAPRQPQPQRPSPVDMIASAGAQEETLVEPARAAQGPDWERVDLPSGFAFYEWSSLSVRRFGPKDQAKLARAVKRRSVTTLLDVLSACCDRDVRDLAYGDFKALCLWHKLNSYLNSPYDMSWTSRYGVRGKATIRRTRLKETRLAATREEYLSWKARGLVTPTCRDVETLASEALDEDETYLFDKAQYVDPEPLAARVAELAALGDRAPSVTARVEELQRRGLFWFAEIEEFAERFADFGIQEIASATLGDSDFDPDRAVAALRATGLPADAQEADAVERAVAGGERPKPREEEVPLGFNLWTMFPYT